MSELPFEIITIILSQVNKHVDDVLQCALTYRSWNLASRQLIFSGIVLSSPKDFNDLLSIAIEDKTLAKLVKEIDAREYNIDLITLHSMAKLFMNLERLSFRSSDQAFEGVYSLLKSREWPRSKRFTNPRNAFQAEMQAKSMEIQKNIISKATLSGFSTSHQLLHDKLYRFPNLESTKIYLALTDDVPSQSFLDTVEEITQKNNLLSLKAISFDLGSHYESLRLYTELDTVQPMFGLLQLKIRLFDSFSIIDDTLMLYIMKKFPNLVNLIINDKTNGSYHSAPNRIRLTANVTIAFLKYLSRLPEFSIGNFPAKKNTTEVIKAHCVELVKNSVNLKLCLSIKYYDRVDFNLVSLPILCVKRNHHKYQPCAEEQWNFEVKFDKRDNIGLNELQLVKEAGYFFQRIEIKKAPNVVYFRLLKYVTRYCFASELLSISYGPKFEDLQVQNFIPNRSLTTLELVDNLSSPNMLLLYSRLFPSLKCLTICKCSVKNSVVNRLFEISLPNMSLDSLSLDITYYEIKSKTITKGLCIILLAGGKFRYLLFTFQIPSEYSLEFTKELAASEYKNVKDDLQYFLCNIDCKSLRKFYFLNNHRRVHQETLY